MRNEQEAVASEATESSSPSTTSTAGQPRARRAIVGGILGLLVVVVGFQAWYLHELREQLTALQNQPATVAGAPDVSLDQPMGTTTERAWNPFEEMQRMHGLMNQAFDRSFARFRQHPMMGAIVAEEMVPRIDVREEPDRFVVTADVPGATVGSVKVDLTGQQLTIVGRRESQSEETDSNGRAIREEREAGAYSRALTLPEPVAAAGMKTDLEDGVLTITVPKASHG
jgi:HSP20 family protein